MLPIGKARYFAERFIKIIFFVYLTFLPKLNFVDTEWILTCRQGMVQHMYKEAGLGTSSGQACPNRVISNLSNMSSHDFFLSSRTNVRDLVVKSSKTKEKGKISLFVRNDNDGQNETAG